MRLSYDQPDDDQVDNGLKPGQLVVVRPYRLIRKVNAENEEYTPTRGAVGTIVAVDVNPQLHEYEDGLSQRALISLMGYGLYWVPAKACTPLD